MPTYAEKRGDQHRTDSTRLSTRSEQSPVSTFQVADNRPEAMQIQRLQEMANGSAQSRQLMQFQKQANGHALQQKLSFQKKGLQTNEQASVRNGETKVVQRVIDATALRGQLQGASEEEPPVEIVNVLKALEAYEQTPGDEALANLIRVSGPARESAPPAYKTALAAIQLAYAEEIANRMVRGKKEWPKFDSPDVEVNDTTKRHAAIGRDAVESASRSIKSGQLQAGQTTLMTFIQGYWILNTPEKAAIKKYAYDPSMAPELNGQGFYAHVKSSDPRYFPKQGIKVPMMTASDEQWHAIELLATSDEPGKIEGFRSATFGVMTILEEVMHLVQEHMGIWHSPDTGKFANTVDKLDFGEGVTDFDEADIVAWIIDQGFPDWAIQKWGMESAYAMRNRFMEWKTG